MNQSLLSNRYLFLDYLNRRGGGEWADVVQINYLEGAINNRLKSSLVSAIASISTNDNKAASRGQERSMVVYPNRSSPDKAPSPGSPTTSSPSDDQMDWEPVKANRLINGRRAPEEKQFVPLEERKCYECGKLGHLAAKCPGKERRQQRVKERAKAEAEWATQKDEMDCEGLYVNFGINRVFHHGLR
ncbi:reverse transcriptase (RNA-dependent DNA polymerase) [Hirsutella rhossiliensis]